MTPNRPDTADPSSDPAGSGRIRNDAVRLDVHGRPIDCHDGCLRHYAGAYYLYGTAYGDTDGFTPANRYVAYRSPDLLRWTPLGDLLDAPLEAVGYRPYVVHNAATAQYVLWFNWYPKLWEGCFGVAVADAPGGPFSVIHDDARVVQPHPGDHNLFVDDDGAAYLIYTSIREDEVGHHRMSVERLDDRYTASTGESSGLFAAGVEAPAMLRRGGWCYALFGRCCCFCPEGSNVAVHRAADPLGPWEAVGEINRGDAGGLIVAAQQTDVARLPAPGGGERWLWMGDRWGSNTDGVKGHDLQHWEPMTFDEGGRPEPLRDLTDWE